MSPDNKTRKISQGVIETTVNHLLDKFEDALPNLNHVVVFLPDSSANQIFRSLLLSKLPSSCNQAVIPPWTGTLNQWISEFISLPDLKDTIISEQSRRLLFIEALIDHPSLFKDENKWQVTIALLTLFDELNFHNTCITDSFDNWLDLVQKAYGIDHNHTNLHKESLLIYTLWHAWHKQLHDNHLKDHSSAYIARLNHAVKNLPANNYFYAVTPELLYPCEIDFINHIKNNEQCTVIQQAIESNDLDLTNTSELSKFILRAFSWKELPLKQRAEDFKINAKPTRLPLSIYFARNSEIEVRAIDIQIRLWLLAGRKHIGIISEDRKLSRRLRALLERANIPLQDMAGWSLSTTSAATILERWLECIEEDFNYRPMLDLLKSHFFSDEVNHESHLENVYRLERDIINHENISHGLNRYKNHLKLRSAKINLWSAKSYTEITCLLDQLLSASEKLVNLYSSQEKHALKHYLDALLESLLALNLNDTLSQDLAGIQIMQTLQDMKQSLDHSNPELLWKDFRTWLALALEDQLFKPSNVASPVQLMTLKQAQIQNFDALVIAADSQHMPGNPDSSPFFNQAARQSLGLGTWEKKHQQRLQFFQQSLQAAPEVLITCKSEDNGEPVPLSPWVETLKKFHGLCYDQSLVNKHLLNLLNENPEVFICDTTQLPVKRTQPSPTIAGNLIPIKMPVSAHQRIIDCPYKFFAADTLKLKPSDEISEGLQKSDYGERVHEIMQAFHFQTKDYPAPFGKKITTNNRELAIKHLTELSRTVFSNNLEDNVLHRSWLHRWMKHIPAYIDWEIEQQENWKITAVEKNFEIAITESTTLSGRLDRIDVSAGENNSHHQIIDYKTGYTPKQDDVNTGEDVQLVTYSLIGEDADHVSYLSLDENNNGVKYTARLSGDELKGLKAEVKTRLQSILSMAEKGHALSAWGDSGVCKYCDFSGLCRRDVWNS